MTDAAEDAGSPAESWTLAGYRVGRLIGRGGFSSVYEAEQVSLGRQVAVKVLTTDLGTDAERRRFDRERSTLVALGEHPHVVDVLDAGISPENRPYLVMRLYRDGTLAQRLATRGQLPLDEVVSVVGKLASALDAAHALGVIHRDVKPENVLLSRDGAPVLSDFGIAQLLDPEGALARTHASTSFFTLAHVAPEILETWKYSIGSDVYALASTTYQLLSGAAPFDVRNPRVTMAILDDAPPPITSVPLPAGVGEVLRRGLAKKPEDRYPSAGAFAAALAAAAGGDAGTPVPPPPTVLTPPGPPGTPPPPPGPWLPPQAVPSPYPPQAVPPPYPPQAVPPSYPPQAVPVPTSYLPQQTPPSVAAGASGGAGAGASGGAGRGAATVPLRRVALVGGVAAVLLLGGCGGMSAFSGTQYSLRSESGTVAVYQGLGFPLPGLTSRRTRSSDVRVEGLPTPEQRKLRDGLGVSGPGQADAVIERLRAEGEHCRTTVAAPCPVGTLARPTVTVAPKRFPEGNKVTVTWKDADPREGVVTRLTAAGEALPTGCPAEVRGSGSCTFTGSFDTDYAVVATVSAPGATAVSTEPVSARSYAAPRIVVRPGVKFDYDGTTYCRIVVDLHGMLPRQAHQVSVEYKDQGTWRAPTMSHTGNTTDERGELLGESLLLKDESYDGYTDHAGGSGGVRVSFGGVSGESGPWNCG